MEISDGLWQFKIPMRFNPLGHTYSYLLIDSATLIDTGVGTGEARSALQIHLEELGLKLSDIERIILTHLHRDHIGLVDFIKSFADAEVYAHENAQDISDKSETQKNSLEREALEDLIELGGEDLIKHVDKLALRFRRQPLSLHIDKKLKDGELIKVGNTSLRVIWTPGHSNEHICILDEERKFLFSGDHVLPRITSHISLHTYDEGDPLLDYLSSLKKLRGLSVELVLPAHEYIFRDLESRISELEQHHSQRCFEILEAIREGKRTVFQISAKISWDSHPWHEMVLWTKRMALAETYAHLVYLRNKSRVIENFFNRVLKYKIKE